MGYSFPDADFELRYLLARFVKHDAKIEVVLRSDNKDVQKRYKGFFGKREVQFKLNGMVDPVVNTVNGRFLD